VLLHARKLCGRLSSFKHGDREDDRAVVVEKVRDRSLVDVELRLLRSHDACARWRARRGRRARPVGVQLSRCAIKQSDLQRSASEKRDRVPSQARGAFSTRKVGGQRGIRTPDTLAGTPDFELPQAPVPDRTVFHPGVVTRMRAHPLPRADTAFPVRIPVTRRDDLVPGQVISLAHAVNMSRKLPSGSSSSAFVASFVRAS
jgi:hypothetical protein